MYKGTNVKCSPKKELCVKNYADLINFINRSTNNGGLIPPSSSCGTPLYNNCDDNLNYIVNNIDSLNYESLYQKISSLNNTQLKNQILFNLAELLRQQTDYKKSPDKLAFFGSFNWWKDNIWGENRMTHYIYIISACICFIGFIYFTFQFINNLSLKLTIAPIIVIGIITLVLMGLMITNLANEATASFSPPTNGENNTDDGETINKSTYNTYKKILISEGVIEGVMALVGIALGLYIILGKSTSTALKTLCLILLIPLIIIFNFYFSFYMPQLLIIGVFIQTLILTQSFTSSSLTSDYYKMFYGIIIALTLLFILINYFIKRNNKSLYYDACSETTSVSSTSLYEIMPYLFMILTITLIVVTNIFAAKSNVANLNNWTLYLAPFVNLIANVK